MEGVTDSLHFFGVHGWAESASWIEKEKAQEAEGPAKTMARPRADDARRVPDQIHLSDHLPNRHATIPERPAAEYADCSTHPR